MDLNQDNLAVWGAPGSKVSYENPKGVIHTLPDVNAGRARWMNNIEFAYQFGNELWKFNISNLTSEKLDPGPVNQLVAGNGQWAIFSEDGLRTSLGAAPNKDWYPLSFSSTGSLVVKDYNKGGLIIWDGVNQTVVSTYPNVEAKFSEGILVYREDNDWFFWTRGTGISTMGRFPANQGFECSFPYLLSWTNFGLAAWHIGIPTEGIIIATDGNNFNWKCLLVGSTLNVVTSQGAGEGPNELRRYEIDIITAPRVDLTKEVSNPVPVRLPNFTPYSIEYYPKEKVQDYYKKYVYVSMGENETRTQDEIISECLSSVPHKQLDVNSDLPTFWPDNYHETVEIYNRAQNVGIKVNKAYECYPVGGLTLGNLELLEDTLSRIEQFLKNNPTCIPTLPFYCQANLTTDNWPLQHVLDLLEGTWNLIIKYKIKRVFDFGAGRPTPNPHPELDEAFRRFKAAVLTENSMPQGTVTIKDYTPKEGEVPLNVIATPVVTGDVKFLHWGWGKNNGPIIYIETIIPAVNFTYRFTAPGIYTLKLIGLDANRNILDQTGMSRTVTVTPSQSNNLKDRLTSIINDLTDLKDKL